MAEKEIESLSISIESISTNVISSLQKTYNNINKLEKSLSKINEISLRGITSKFTTMAKAVNKFNDILGDNSKMSATVSNISKFSSFLTKVSKTDMTTLATQFERMNQAIEPFLSTLSRNSEVLTNFAKTLDFSRIIGQYDKAIARAELLNEKTKTQAEKTKLVETNRQKANVQLEIAEKRLSNIDSYQNSLNKKTGIWSKLWKIGKIGFAIKLFGRLANRIGNVINLSADFNETLNKFQSATQSQYKDAIRFANNLAQSFGLARQTVMEYQSTFMNMLNSLEGLGDSVANELSKNLTIMAIDYASLFNTSIEQAMTAFQSMLSGRTMAIRTASGIDVTDNTIYEYYKQLGGTKTRTALSQLEKRLLRILAVYEQMNKAFAVGDYAETVENFSNQARILKEQLEELGTWLGNVFIGLLSDVIKYINAIVITTKEVVKNFAFLVGYTYQEPKPSILNSIEGEADGALESVEKLEEKLGLLSFDRFEVLGTAKKTGESTDIGLIQSELNKQMEDLQSKMQSVEFQALKISDSWLKFLGYTKEVNEETGETTYKLNEFYTNIEAIRNIILSIISFKIANKMDEFIVKLVDISKKTSTLNSVLTGLQKVGIFGLIYSITTLITSWDRLSNSQKALYITMGALSAVIVVITTLMKAHNTITATNIAITKANTLMSNQFTNALINQKFAWMGLGLAISGAVIGGLFAYVKAMDSMDSNTKIWVGSLMTLAGAFTSVAVAIAAMHSALTLGVAVPAIIAGVASAGVGIYSIVKGSQEKIRGYETGGFPTKGNLFYANENGKPEMIGSMGSRTTVANNYQIIEGIKSGVKEAIAESNFGNGNNEVKLVVDGSRVNNSAFARAIMPALKIENKRTGGRSL